MLHDALGRQLVLPLALCGTYEVGSLLSCLAMLRPLQGFHATLVNLFSGTDGHWFVNARRYTISIDEAITTSFDPSLSYWNWGRVKPGIELTMHADLYQASLEHTYSYSLSTYYDSGAFFHNLTSSRPIMCPMCDLQAPGRSGQYKTHWLVFT